MNFNIEFKIPAVPIVLDPSDVHAFCEHVVITYSEAAPNHIYEMSALWLYNKLRKKTSKKKVTIQVPIEYAWMLKKHTSTAIPYSDLQRIALYNILEQLDKKIPS